MVFLQPPRDPQSLSELCFGFDRVALRLEQQTEVIKGTGKIHAVVAGQLSQQLKLYRKQIEALFQQHPDQDLFGSLPGAKQMLAPRLLGAVGNDPERYGSQQVLQCIAGTAPVSYDSGQLHQVHVRWACDKFLRHTVHLWANCFRQKSAWGQAYYQQKRQQGMNHACALRCLAQRLLKILFRMLQDRKPYDAELHARNQQKHGSWVLKLVNQSPA